ncbi:MAG: replication protein [Caldilineaceae bacterium]|nr:replication protein [Caldilineaceae bacterium]
MEKLGTSIQTTSVADVVRRARAQSYEKRLSVAQEREVKDIGGILVPNAFQVPNEVVDDGWLKELGGSEIKVLIFITRKTFGFNKIGGDRIPLSQIIDGTGLSRQATVSAIQVLENCHLIRVVRGTSQDGVRKMNFYQLITRTDYNRSKRG